MAGTMRLQRELKQFQKSDLEDDAINKWCIWLFGPPDTAFAGAAFKCLIRFPNTYPMDPPSWQFLSPIFHPNIYFDGKVCVSILQQPVPGSEGGGFWSPALDIHSICQSILSLLSQPNPSDPANAEAAALRVSQIVEDSRSSLPQDILQIANTALAGTHEKQSGPTSAPSTPESDHAFMYDSDDAQETSDDEDSENDDDHNDVCNVDNDDGADIHLCVDHIADDRISHVTDVPSTQNMEVEGIRQHHGRQIAGKFQDEKNIDITDEHAPKDYNDFNIFEHNDDEKHTTIDLGDFQTSHLHEAVVVTTCREMSKHGLTDSKSFIVHNRSLSNAGEESRNHLENVNSVLQLENSESSSFSSTIKARSVSMEHPEQLLYASRSASELAEDEFRHEQDDLFLSTCPDISCFEGQIIHSSKRAKRELPSVMAPPTAHVYTTETRHDGS